MIIKVNASGAFPVEIADTTHPAVVAAMVRICKEASNAVGVPLPFFVPISGG